MPSHDRSIALRCGVFSVDSDPQLNRPLRPCALWAALIALAAGGCSTPAQPRPTTPQTCPTAAPAPVATQNAPVPSTPPAPCATPPVPIVRAQPNEPSSWLLGAVCGGRFIRAAEAAPFVAEGRYRVLSAREYPRSAAGTRTSTDATALCPALHVVTLTPAPQLGEWLAVGGDWPLAPSSIQMPEVEPRHEQTVRGLLAARGMQNAAIVVTQLMRADLEHDGSPDDVIVATIGRLAEDNPTGAYSMVVLQRVHDGATSDIPLEVSVPAQTPGAPHDIFHVNDLLDLNGDGTLEILIERNSEAGWGVSVFDALGTRTAVGERCGS